MVAFLYAAFQSSTHFNLDLILNVGNGLRCVIRIEELLILKGKPLKEIEPLER